MKKFKTVIEEAFDIQKRGGYTRLLINGKAVTSVMIPFSGTINVLFVGDEMATVYPRGTEVEVEVV